jgi:small nuclear ribonucleoprotein (snRNP)-like protein
MAGLDILQPKDLIGLTLRVEITDSRVLTGVLLALDNRPNLLLTNVSESSQQRLLSKPNDLQTVTRSLGLVSVPYETIKTVKVATSEVEKLAEWASSVV